MRVYFNADAGLGKGAIIQEGDPVEYMPAEFCRLELDVGNLTYAFGFHPDEYDDDGQIEKLRPFEHLRGMGQIQGGLRHGFPLSIFGSERVFEKVDITIHRRKTDHAVLVPQDISSEEDYAVHAPRSIPSEGIVLEIELGETHFDTLWSQVQLLASAQLQISVRLDEFRGAYAAWSPLVDEGRIVRILGDREDVENASEMPEGYGARSGYMDELRFNPSQIHFETGRYSRDFWINISYDVWI